MKGSMLAVGLSNEETQQYLGMVRMHFKTLRLAAACINSPKSVTVSGDEDQIDELHDLLGQNQIFSRKLAVNVAYHSFQMQEIASDYRKAIGYLEKRPERSTAPVLMSSVTGDWVSPDELADAEYWVKNLVSPVLFSDAVTRICSFSGPAARKIDNSHRFAVSINHLLEIGPHSALQGPCRDILQSIKKQDEIVYLALLVRNKSALITTLNCAGRLHCYGYPINLSLEIGRAHV